MRRRRRLLVFFIILLVVLAVGTVLYIFTKEDKESTLNLFEKQWIENNKNKMIDFGIVNNIAVLNSSTDSLVFDYINKLEKSTGLEFNKVSYDYEDEIKEDYGFKVGRKKNKNDITVYVDNYVLVSKTNKKYNSVQEIPVKQVLVKSDLLEEANKYLDNENFTFRATERSYLEEIENYSFSDTADYYILMPKLLFLSYYESYKDVYINYNISELKDYYTISLGKTKKLNDILTKYYKKWEKENYTELFGTAYTDAYYNYSGATEQAKVKFRSKRYVYGFVDNSPFDIEANNKLYGISSTILKDFAHLTKVEIKYKKYSSISKLQKAFSKNEIDFMINRYGKYDYKTDTYNTVSVFDEEIVLASKLNNSVVINSLNSLSNTEVGVLKSTKIAEELKKKAKLKEYDTLKELMRSKGIIAIDKATYDFYKDKYFKDYKIDYTYNLKSDYTYLVRDIKDNKVFEEFFNFYLTFINDRTIYVDGYNDALLSINENNFVKYLIIAGCELVALLVVFFIGGRFAPHKKHEKRRKLNIKKEDKLRYIDMLTSLKNRNYLNDNIEKWDESEVYPQSIIIIDLNNIAYINDNYGHQEGDNVIKEAAGKLITLQIPNSDIIRTNGNEFLLYLIGYDEKQVVAYTKKLMKELKEISHGFGAAIGYSMITDGIKTIDDAVNEATLDMRQNKEETN